MSEKLRDVYRKFLYGGSDEATTSSLYSGVQTKSRTILPAALDIQSATTPSIFPQAAKAARESITIPKADDVELPEVKEVVISQMSPVLQAGSNGTPSGDTSTFKQEVARVESGGDYRAQNKHSSAVGKYQFLWNTWGKDITKVTGVSSKEDFRNNPQAQEKYMDYYTGKVVAPAVKVLRKITGAQAYSDSDLSKMIHFQGLGGAAKQLKKGELAGATKTNLSVKEYLRRSKR